MLNSQILNDLVTFLRSKNVLEEEIKKVTEEITNAASGRFYAEFMENLPEEELKNLDQINDDSQASAKIRDLVYDKTGKSVDQIISEYTDATATEVLKEARVRYS